MSIRKPYNQKLGYVASLKLPNGEYAVIYDNKNGQLGIDTGGLRWVTVREPKGNMIASSSLPLARGIMKEWRYDIKQMNSTQQICKNCGDPVKLGVCLKYRCQPTGGNTMKCDHNWTLHKGVLGYECMKCSKCGTEDKE